MEFNSIILKATLIGTSRQKVSVSDFPEFMRSDVQILLDSTHNYEDGFLKSLAMMCTLDNSAAAPIRNDITILQASPKETASYIPDKDIRLLKYLKDNKLFLLILKVIALIVKYQLVLPPIYLVEFIDWAFNEKNKYSYQLRLAIWPLLGTRGKWFVSNCRPDINIGWKNASFEQRLKMFVAMRKSGSALACSRLAITWNTDSEQNKLRFLSVFISVRDEDLDFLENVYADVDTSAEVRMAVFKLLRRHKNSSIVKRYCSILGSIASIDGRNHISFDNFELTPELEQIGINDVVTKEDGYPDFVSKLSSTEIAVLKLVHSVPLDFWRSFTGLDTEGAVGFLTKNPAFRYGFDFTKVIRLFGDSEWAAQHCRCVGVLMPELVSVMSAQDLDDTIDYVEFDKHFVVDSSICRRDDMLQPWERIFSDALVRYIIKSRSFDNSDIVAQMLAVKLDKAADVVIECFLSSNSGNDTLISFLKKVAGYRNMLRMYI
jgi:hypothetical protein